MGEELGPRWRVVPTWASSVAGTGRSEFQLRLPFASWAFLTSFRCSSFCFTDAGDTDLSVLRNGLVWLQRLARPEAAGPAVKPCLPQHRAGRGAMSPRPKPGRCGFPPAGRSACHSAQALGGRTRPEVEDGLLYSHVQGKNTLAETRTAMLGQLPGHRGPATSARKPARGRRARPT